MGAARGIMATSEFPKKLFIESSILFQLGPRLENVEFAKLLDIRGAAGFKTLVSEVSWLEYLRERKRELRVHLNATVNTQRTLDLHGKSISECVEACEK
jgi:hypothetical protein